MRVYQNVTVWQQTSICKHPFMMKYILFQTILFAYFVAAPANSSVKPTTSNEVKKAANCNANNNFISFYAGPNCKKIEQQLLKELAEMKKEILEEIRALKRNKTGGPGEKGLLNSVLNLNVLSVVVL